MNKIISLLWVALTVIVLCWWQNHISYASNISSQNTKIIAQDKLDAFLNKVVNMKSKFNTDKKYEVFLDDMMIKMKWLWTKYSSNTTISEMIDYLEKWLKKIKSEFLKNKDLNSFLCDIDDDCSPPLTTTPTTTDITQNRSNTTSNTNISTSTTINNTPTTSTTSAEPTVLLSWVLHKVKWYDLSKSNYIYNYGAMKLKSKQMWITYDFSSNISEVYNSVIQGEDFCKSKWKWYRLPKTYELQHLYDLKKSIEMSFMWWNKNGFYGIERADNNNNFSKVTLLIPDFISLEVLPKVVIWKPIFWTYSIEFPAWTDNNFDNMLFKIWNSMLLAKNDDDTYYHTRYDGYSIKLEKKPYYSHEIPTITSILCVVDDL